MKEVIRFSGKKDDLFWVYPKTSISQDAEIYVEPGFIAVMVRNGEMELPFPTGASKVFKEKDNNILSQFKSINNCNIYFFNKTKDVSTREWGTRYPVKYFDKRYNMELSMRGHGTYRIFLDNHRLFINSFKLDNSFIPSIEAQIKEIVMARMSEVIAKVLTDNKGENIHGSYDLITKLALEKLNNELEKIGLNIFDLRITYLSPVEEEQINALKDIHLKTVIYNREIDLGKSVKAESELHCPKCNATITNEMKFCSNCGESLTPRMDGE